MKSVIGNTPEDIEVRDIQLFIQGDTNVRITGAIKNTSDQDFEELEVQATLIDDEDDILGKWFDDTEEREAGGLASSQTWEFTVAFETPDLDTVARYRVDVDGDIDQSVWDGDSGTTTGTETTTSCPHRP